jgi:hypothetical protein
MSSERTIISAESINVRNARIVIQACGDLMDQSVSRIIRFSDG